MGIAQLGAARSAGHGADGSLAIEAMPVVGLVKTHPLDELVTDSAAGATAFATGAKTRNGRVAMTAANEALETILEAARARGLGTGIVVTSTITHATPACFAAHVPHRSDETGIARQLVGSGIDVLLGGGRAFFVPASTPGSRRKDALDLLRQAEAQGYHVIATAAELMAVAAAPVLGLFAPEALPPPDAVTPSLEQMTRRALALLGRAGRGFVLMVEGSQIDWGGHANDLGRVVSQTLEFDAAVAAGLEFAAAHGDTLVVVTADHETGGLALIGGSTGTATPTVGWASVWHTAVDVPLFAAGPGAAGFAGVIDNAEVGRRLAAAMGLGPLPRLLDTTP
ncbi:MAG: alkaline phosphatase [Gammaproteobacteria bacterium]|nr:alkaline phosphatase [Gammaproteobacteria bacterium]